MPTVEVTDDDMQKVCGSKDSRFNYQLVREAISSVRFFDSDDKETVDRKAGAVMAAMAGVAPRNELEGMLACQLVALHESAMECFRRAQISEQTFEGRDQNLKHGVKLSRTYAALLETLDKHRGKGKQTIKVVHQHVYAQAGGNVNVAGTADRGEGYTDFSKEQSHAHESEPVEGKPCLPHEPAMRCEDTLRQAMPVASDARKEAVPHARRKGRSAEGE